MINQKLKPILKKIIPFLLILLLTLAYTYLIPAADGDEIWSYGFAYNIANGLIPYKDYNMIITPLFPFLASIFIKIAQNNLLGMHIFNALCIIAIIFISQKKYGIKAWIMYPILTILPSTMGYNNLATYLMIILLIVLDSPNSTKKEILIPLLVSLIFLTKQTIGACLLIPCLFYAPKKFKAFIIFLIPNLILAIYLIYHNCLYQFLDYCFFGLFEFGNSNTIISIFTLIEFLIILVLITLQIKDHGRNQPLFYILMFQIVVFPIVDPGHFFTGVIPLIYLIIKKTNFSKKATIITFILVLTATLAIEVIRDYRFSSQIELYPVKSNIQYRNVGEGVSDTISHFTAYITKEQENYDNLYNFSYLAYISKLINNTPINKYDLINSGNMGYKGEEKYIKEITKTCSKETCLFVVNDAELNSEDKNSQTSTKIIKYIDENYLLTKTFMGYNIYNNQNIIEK